MQKAHHRHYILRIVLLLLAIIALGTTGFVVIEGWSVSDALYMVIITFTTIGYQEIHSLSEAGRIFNMFLIVGGLGIFAYAFSFISSQLLDGHFKKKFLRKFMDKKINKLEQHFILCGFGEIGRQIADEFANHQTPFVIIENNPDAITEIESTGYLYIDGAAADEEILKKAGIEQAKGLVTVVGDDADNVFIVLTARSLSKDLFIVSRANSNETIPKLEQAGANKVSVSHRISGYHIAAMTIHPSVIDFLDLVTHQCKDNFRIEEILIGKNSPAVGRQLTDFFARERNGVSPLAIFRTQTDPLLNPAPTETIHAEDRIVVMANKNDLEAAISRLEQNI